MAMNQIPQHIGGFEILGMLGRGGMGVVYRARDHALERELALKLQSGNWKNNPERLQRFLREARILAKINHPNVVQIYSVGEHDGAPFFVMELLAGSVADAADRQPLTLAQVKRWILEAARGLAAIHEMGVVHRDIKPGNLLLTRATSLEHEHVKVADLGIASAGEQFGMALTRGGVVLGTSGYLPPESFRAEHTLDGRADQYSLGVVFFELLAGRSPYRDMGDAALIAAILTPREPPDVRDIRPDVDAGTAQTLIRMLQDDPDRRFQSTAELVKALAQIQDSPSTPDQRLVSLSVAPTRPSRQTAPSGRLPLADSIRIEAPQAPAHPPAPRIVGTWATGALAALALALMGILVWNFCPPTTDAEVPDSRRDALPPSAAAREPTIDPLKREAWAKYVLARYHLQTLNDEEKWTLDLVDQRSGVLEAELLGPEEEPIEMSGRVESHRIRTVDGEDLETYRLKLLGPADIEMTVDFVFSDADSKGKGKLVYYGEIERFKVLSSVDL